MALVLVLPDDSRYQELHLGNALEPRSWTAVARSGHAENLGDLAAQGTCEVFFDDLVKSLGRPAQLILISVEQDQAGRHRFISLFKALQSLLLRRGESPLTCYEEAEAKALRDSSDAVFIYARPASENTAVVESDANVTEKAHRSPIPTSLTDRELCPHGSIWARNYTVISELSIGPTQRLILCDEATLMRSLPAERIFEHLSLIVNCHESRATAGKYVVGSCSSKDPPKAIFQAVHEWHNLRDEMNLVNDSIQQSMWDHLQQGTVAVHCLAGIHRAAVIVACHFLWRHYVLGHQDVSCDPKVIYQQLQAVRPAVQPAYSHVLSKYEAHLKKKCRRGQ